MFVSLPEFQQIPSGAMLQVRVLSYLWGMMFHNLDLGSVVAQRGVLKYEFPEVCSKNSHKQFAQSLQNRSFLHLEQTRE